MSGLVITIIVLLIIILYQAITAYYDRSFYLATIKQLHEQLMAKSLNEYATAKPKLYRKPDEPVTSEERLAEVFQHELDSDYIDVGA